MALVSGFLGTYRLVHRDANDNTIAELLEKDAGEFGIVSATSTPETDAQKMPKTAQRHSEQSVKSKRANLRFWEKTTSLFSWQSQQQQSRAM